MVLKLNHCSKLITSFALSAGLACTSGCPAYSQLSDYDARNQAAILTNEAVVLMNSSKIEQAASKLAEASKLDPSNAITLNNYGIALLKLAKLDDARVQLEKAMKVDPQLDLPYQNMGLVYEAMGNLESARSFLQKYIALSRNREQADKTREHLKLLEANIAKGAKQASINSDDYFGPDMYRWPNDTIKIYVEAGEKVDGFKASYGQDLEDAIAEWGKALDGLVKFERVDKAGAADIEIHWASDYKNAVSKGEGGDCKYTMRGAKLTHAIITLLTVDPSPTDKQNDTRVTWVCLHELGHALGFHSHSNNPGDIMYFAVSQSSTRPTLSERDIHSFKRVYSTPSQTSK